MKNDLFYVKADFGNRYCEYIGFLWDNNVYEIVKVIKCNCAAVGGGVCSKGQSWKSDSAKKLDNQYLQLLKALY